MRASASRTLTGRIAAATGQGVPGATVLLKGTTLGATSGNDGAYSLTGTRPAGAADQRLPFLVRANPTATQNRGLALHAANNAPIPVDLPGEVLLIQAEADARLHNLPFALLALNRVLTRTPAQDIYGLGAALPAYAGAVAQPRARCYSKSCATAPSSWLSRASACPTAAALACLGPPHRAREQFCHAGRPGAIARRP